MSRKTVSMCYVRTDKRCCLFWRYGFCLHSRLKQKPSLTEFVKSVLCLSYSDVSSLFFCIFTLVAYYSFSVFIRDSFLLLIYFHILTFILPWKWLESGMALQNQTYSFSVATCNISKDFLHLIYKFLDLIYMDHLQTVKFQEWRPHLNTGVNPLNYRSVFVRNTTHSWDCYDWHCGNHGNSLASCAFGILYCFDQSNITATKC